MDRNLINPQAVDAWKNLEWAEEMLARAKLVRDCVSAWGKKDKAKFDIAVEKFSSSLFLARGATKEIPLVAPVLAEGPGSERWKRPAGDIARAMAHVIRMEAERIKDETNPSFHAEGVGEAVIFQAVWLVPGDPSNIAPVEIPARDAFKAKVGPAWNVIKKLRLPDPDVAEIDVKEMPWDGFSTLAVKASCRWDLR